MPQLWLKFKDDNGEENRIALDRDVFTVGRHSENDLTITDSRLSRVHIRMERDGDDFLVSDSGSSNGTILNGEDLIGPAKLKDGDILNLGGGLEIQVELAGDAVAVGNATPETVSNVPEGPPGLSAASTAPPAVATASAANPNAIPTSFFIIAPLLGIFMLIFVGGLIYIFSGNSEEVVADNSDEFVYSTDKDDESPSKRNDSDSTPAVKSPVQSSSDGQSGNTTRNDLPAPVTQTPPQNLSETGRIEQNAAVFLRSIAQNDTKAFLTGEQASRANIKIKQFGRSAALADNINSAKKNAAQIRMLAASKNLKPQFLAVAAIAKLGNGRGDVIQTAQSIAEVFSKLSAHIGTEMADDSLLMVAAYNQGAAGDVMKMRNMLQDLANRSPDSARAIRTIWFLEKNSKITQDEFENALNFLAVGTITQNPKEFGVNAEALKL